MGRKRKILNYLVQIFIKQILRSLIMIKFNLPDITPIVMYRKKNFLTKKLKRNPIDAMTAPITGVHLQPYLFVKIEAIGPLNKVTAGNSECTMLASA